MFAQLLQKQLQLPLYEEAIRHNGRNKAGSCAESLCHPPSRASIPLFFQGLRHTTLSLTSSHTVCSHAWPADFSGRIYLAWLQLADGAAAARRQSLTDVWRLEVRFMLKKQGKQESRKQTKQCEQIALLRWSSQIHQVGYISYRTLSAYIHYTHVG